MAKPSPSVSMTEQPPASGMSRPARTVPSFITTCKEGELCILQKAYILQTERKLSSNEKLKDDFGKKAKKTYEEFKKELPVGFVDKDLNIIDSLTSKYCGFELIDKTGIEDDMYIIN